MWSFLDLTKPQEMHPSFSDSLARYYRSIARDKFFTFRDDRYNRDDDQNLVFYKLSGGKDACYLVNYIQLYNAISEHVARDFKLTEIGDRYRENMRDYLLFIQKTDTPTSCDISEEQPLLRMVQALGKGLKQLKRHCRYEKNSIYDTCMSRLYTQVGSHRWSSVPWNQDRMGYSYPGRDGEPSRVFLATVQYYVFSNSKLERIFSNF